MSHQTDVSEMTKSTEHIDMAVALPSALRQASDGWSNPPVSQANSADHTVKANNLGSTKGGDHVEGSDFSQVSFRKDPARETAPESEGNPAIDVDVEVQYDDRPPVHGIVEPQNVGITSMCDNVSLMESVAPSEEDSTTCSRRGFWILLALLAVVGALGTGIGVPLSKKKSNAAQVERGMNTNPTSAPSMAERCSFCYDGTIPEDLASKPFGGSGTCQDFYNQQTLLLASDEACPVLQASAWNDCQCPTLPPRPERPTCTLCVGGGITTSNDTKCLNVDTFVALVGSSSLFSCADIQTLILADCSCPPLSNSLETFRHILGPLSGDEVLRDESSPQYKALDWLRNDDPSNLQLNSTAIDIILQRYAAATMYFAMNGPGWIIDANFLSDGDMCNWNMNDTGIQCDKELGAVTGLKMFSNNLAGTIPKEVGIFSELQVIEFGSNFLSGSLPSFPSKVQTLSLFDNNLSGKIPAVLGQSTSMVFLDLEKNNLTGTLPDFSPKSELQYLFLGSNRLSGRIPDSMSNLPDLAKLSLPKNLLTGIVPLFIGGNASVEDIDLADNALVGKFSDWLTSLNPGRMTSLHVEGNKFTGSIPSSIGLYSNLNDLRLQNNAFSSTIPSEIGMLKNLSKVLLFSNNDLQGAIPTEIGLLTNLQDSLFFNENHLVGTLPSELGMLTAVQNLAFDDNVITGTIPSQIQNCQLLLRFFASGNLITGRIEDVLSNMPSGIELLNLNNNSLSGQMSTSIGRLGALKELALERNAITGVIPTEIGLATSLINILQLNFNQISGSIPSEIGLLTSLLLFDASHNALTGTIPLEISSLQSLEGVDVGNNTLTGTPTPLFDLPAIKALVISDNAFDSVDGVCARSVPFDFLAVNPCDSQPYSCSCCTHCCTLRECTKLKSL